VAGQFVSRVFVVLLRKRFPQNHNLQTAAVLSVMYHKENEMLKIIPFILGVGFTAFAVADSGQVKMAVGKWSIAPEWVNKFAPECRGMTLEVTNDGKIIRTTGELSYTSKATFTEINNKVQVDESLIESNLKPSCAGVPASKIVTHLKHKAFFTVDKDRLMYYRNADNNSLIIFSKN
jgi:hypothetical protein